MKIWMFESLKRKMIDFKQQRNFNEEFKIFNDWKCKAKLTKIEMTLFVYMLNKQGKVGEL